MGGGGRGKREKSLKHCASGISTIRHQSAAEGQDTLEDMDCPMKGEVFAHVAKSKALDWLSISPCHILWLADIQVNKSH